MDTQTRHALKQDRLVDATRTSVDWFQDHRNTMIRAAVAAVILIAVLIAAVVIYTQRSAAADLAFGQAMDTYNTPVTQPGQPPAPGEKTFATAAARATLANQQFTQVANQYGLFGSGKTARYFEGLTAVDLGQPGAGRDLSEKGCGWVRCSTGFAGKAGIGWALPADQSQQRGGGVVQPVDCQTHHDGARGCGPVATRSALREDQSGRGQQDLRSAQGLENRCRPDRGAKASAEIAFCSVGCCCARLLHRVGLEFAVIVEADADVGANAGN